LVVVDALTKVLAVLVLPMSHAVRRDALLDVTWGRTLAEQHTEFAWDASKAVAIFALAGAILIVRRLGVRPRLVWIVVPIAVVAVAYGVGAVVPPISHRSAVLLTRASQSALWLTLWAVSVAGMWQPACALMAASALGNFLSLCYPPYAISGSSTSRTSSTSSGSACSAWPSSAG